MVYICRLEFTEGVDALLIALLYDAYSDDRSCTCVNLKIIVTKFEQQCYRESLEGLYVRYNIPGKGTASLAVNVDRSQADEIVRRCLIFHFVNQIMCFVYF